MEIFNFFRDFFKFILFIRMTIILKLNTFVRDSSPNQIGTPLSRRSSHYLIYAVLWFYTYDFYCYITVNDLLLTDWFWTRFWNLLVLKLSYDWVLKLGER
jgi:hypothetical protein